MKILIFLVNMNSKTLSTISLWIFGVVVSAILVAGLVFYQNNSINSSNQTSGNQVVNNNSNNKIKDNKTVKQVVSTTPTGTILNMVEISKHKKENDCWLLINGKVYDITSYFGKHPGGNGAMSATCGTDATDAYMTQDPYANSSGNRSAHSNKAKNLLNGYYIGDLNNYINK